MVKINPTKLVVLDETQPDTDQVTKAGIIVPGAIVKTPTMKGRVVVKGDGTPEIPVLHEVGSIALFNPRAGQKFEWEGKEYRIVDVSEIFLSGV